jgi:hypothetical protein
LFSHRVELVCALTEGVSFILLFKDDVLVQHLRILRIRQSILSLRLVKAIGALQVIIVYILTKIPVPHRRWNPMIIIANENYRSEEIIHGTAFGLYRP